MGASEDGNGNDGSEWERNGNESSRPVKSVSAPYFLQGLTNLRVKERISLL